MDDSDTWPLSLAYSNVVGFAGSLRRASSNRALLRASADPKRFEWYSRGRRFHPG